MSGDRFKLHCEVLPHPTYSPDLLPSDFHLLAPLKVHLGGHKFHMNDEVSQEVLQWLRDSQKNSMLPKYRHL